MEPSKLKKAKLEHSTEKMRAKRAWMTNYYRELTSSLFNGNHFCSSKYLQIFRTNQTVFEFATPNRGRGERKKVTPRSAGRFKLS